MKKIHYLNIGMAKAGTTSMYNTLLSHPEIDFQGIKENFLYSHHGQSLANYKNYYKEFNVSMNFCPWLWTMENRQMAELDTVVTHYSMMFRNPFEFIKSLYNFLPKITSNITQEYNLWAESMLEVNLLDYGKILEHWDPIRQRRPFKIMFYDDLKTDNEFYNLIAEFLGLQPYNFNIKVNNVTKYTNTGEQQLSNKNIKSINQLIDKFEQKVNKDLSHWKLDI